MKELLLLAKSKGFQPRTFSTIWTFRGIAGENKEVGITKTCQSNLLNEIQKWLREEYKVETVVHPVFVEKAASTVKYDWYILYDISKDAIEDDGLPSHTYELALEKALNEALKLTK